MVNGVSFAQQRELMLWSDESPEALVELNDKLKDERLGEKEWRGRTKSNNSFNPTARQHGFHHCPLRSARMLFARCGLIRALGAD
jgi:hypothetical protein